MSAFDHFIREIEVWPNGPSPTWAEQLAEWRRIMVRLDGLVEDAPHLIDFLDELERIVQSGGPVKQRFGRVLEAFTAASKVCPDPARKLS